MDGDGDVDQTDFGTFQACITEENHVQTDLACKLARLDSDSDVDADDAPLFVQCMSGSNIEPDPHCLDSVPSDQ
jgi:hypothetical protein